MHSISCRYFGNIENTRRPGITYRHSALASKIDRLIFHQFRSKSTIKTSQNYSSPLNACIDRAACGSCARFYTDSYTAGPDRGILARLSSPRSVPFARPCSLFPAFPASLTSLDTPCFPLPQREPSSYESPVFMRLIERTALFSHEFPHEMALYGEGKGNRERAATKASTSPAPPYKGTYQEWFA